MQVTWHCWSPSRTKRGEAVLSKIQNLFINCWEIGTWSIAGPQGCNRRVFVRKQGKHCSNCRILKRIHLTSAFRSSTYNGIIRNWVGRKRCERENIQRPLLWKNRRKPRCVLFSSKVSANLTHYIRCRSHATTHLSNWNQNMAIIGTVTSTSQKILIALNLPQIIVDSETI